MIKNPLYIPGKTSEAQQMIRELRALHSAMAGTSAEIAAVFRRVLPEVIKERGGARGSMLGVDTHIAAYRCAKPFMTASSLNTNLARCYVIGNQRLEEYVINPTAASAARRGFIVDS